MRLSQKSINRISNINWFANVGVMQNIPDIIVENSLSEAALKLSESQWEDTTLEASNSISAFVSVNFPKLFDDWNIVAQEARLFFDAKITSSIPSINGIDNNLLIHCVSWDITHYFIEDYYKECLRGDLFFNRLVSVYESGHLPCGWNGKWPSGKLIIY
ncbi:MAG: hypothetical protein PW844_05935 [Pantoea sp.]|uniref:hypothetical protein n=1 Tax=Pantoea sp. TaxID=69393 RepID=UPI002384618E|nr:hypothetical protein [Pantoea sp.]MDE1186006.1 hypothetical protein [Pantoea sp.]